MSATEPSSPGNDRAWPRGALPFSTTVALLGLAGGLLITAKREWPVASLGLLLAGLIAGGSLLIVATKRWVLRGLPVPAYTGLVSGGLALVAIFAGIEAILGLVSGMMFANVWAIRRVRAVRTRQS